MNQMGGIQDPWLRWVTQKTHESDGKHTRPMDQVYIARKNPDRDIYLTVQNHDLIFLLHCLPVSSSLPFPEAFLIKKESQNFLGAY